jgi:hypothetical protein
MNPSKICSFSPVMMRGNLPPQAYTREVVATAYNWLQAQPENVRRMAQNTDTLVALYLRAKRNAENAQTLEQEPAAGVENFRSQLKNLATEIQQFAPEQEKYIPASLPQEIVNNYVPNHNANHNVSHNNGHNVSHANHHPSPPPKASSTSVDFNSLDPHSLEILKKVRQHLNLGSDVEAMRMLLVLGFEKLQSLFK